MTLPSGPLGIVIPAKAGIHLSACESLPNSHERRGYLPRGSLAAPWVPAFAGMTLLEVRHP